MSNQFTKLNERFGLHLQKHVEDNFGVVNRIEPFFLEKYDNTDFVLDSNQILFVSSMNIESDNDEIQHESRIYSNFSDSFVFKSIFIAQEPNETKHYQTISRLTNFFVKRMTSLTPDTRFTNIVGYLVEFEYIENYFARFFTVASTWVGNLLKSSTSELYIEPTGRNCFESTAENALVSSTLLPLTSKWSVWMNLSKTSINSGWDCWGGSTTSGTHIYGFRNGGGSTVVLFRTLDGTFIGTWNTSNITDGDILMISDGSKVDVYYNSVLVDTINGTVNITIDTMFNFASPSGGIGMLGKCNDFKVKDLTSYTGDFTPEAIDALGWDHHFPLDQWKAGSTPASVRYSDVIGGITATLVNGTVPDNLGARSDNSKSYNWNGFTLDGDEYVPAKDDGSGLDVDGNPLTNPALNNGSAHNGNEQKMRFTTVPQELIDIDVDNQFQVAGVATDWYPQDVAAAYIEKTVTGNNSVTDLKIYK